MRTVYYANYFLRLISASNLQNTCPNTCIKIHPVTPHLLNMLYCLLRIDIWNFIATETSVRIFPPYGFSHFYNVHSCSALFLAVRYSQCGFLPPGHLLLGAYLRHLYSSDKSIGSLPINSKGVRDTHTDMHTYTHTISFSVRNQGSFP